MSNFFIGKKMNPEIIRPLSGAPGTKISLQIQGYFSLFTLEFSFPGCHFVEDHYKVQLQLQLKAIAHAHNAKAALLFCLRGRP